MKIQLTLEYIEELKGLTKSEMLLKLYFDAIRGDDGVIIYSTKEAISFLKIPRATFYKAMYGLRDKGVLHKPERLFSYSSNK